MAQHAHGLGTVPGGEGVGGETTMNKCHVTSELWISEIWVVGSYLGRSELPFVHNSSGGEGAEVGVVVRKAGFTETLLGQLSK